MIYHYRQGMEPEIDNFRRMKLIANYVTDVSCEVSLQPVLKLPPNWKANLFSLYLSEEKPDSQVVQRIVMRASADLKRRMKLATLAAYATPDDRRDIMQVLVIRPENLSMSLIRTIPEGSCRSARTNRESAAEW